MKRFFSVSSVFVLCIVVGSCDETGRINRSDPAPLTSVPHTPERSKTEPITTAEVDKTVSIGGRVLKSNGQGISNARVAISGGNYPEPVFVFTSPSGDYTFKDVPAGGWYVVTVRANPTVFKTPSRVVAVNSEVSNVDFTAEPPK